VLLRFLPHAAVADDIILFSWLNGHGEDPLRQAAACRQPLEISR
jgi:hypothetical protein